MPKSVRQRPAPLSLRLTEPERIALNGRAGSLPISRYIKQVLFADGSTSLRRLPRRVSADPVMIAKVLAQLGASQLASSLTRLARAADNGSLYIDDDTAVRLRAACDDIRQMHDALMAALGKRPAGSKPHAERLAVTFQVAAFNPEDQQ